LISLASGQRIMPAPTVCVGVLVNQDEAAGVPVPTIAVEKQRDAVRSWMRPMSFMPISGDVSIL